MHRKFLFLIVLALLAVTLVPALAQANSLAYVYNGETKTLIRINTDGTSADYNLGLSADTFVSPFDMAFTADGSRVALCAVTYPAGMGETAVQPTAQFILRDIAAGTNLIQQDLGAAIGCRTGQHAFNADESLVALSRINYYPGDPNADLSQPSWQITLIETATGNAAAELNNLSPAVVEYTLASEGIIPYIQRVDGSSVIFAEVPYGVGGGAEWAAYEWQRDAGTVTPVTTWGNLDLDLLPTTNETVWTGIDDSRPAATPNGPIPPNNVVRLLDNNSGQQSVIFHTPDWQVFDATFIEGGQRIAVMLYTFDPQTNLPAVRWIALDRAGVQTTLIESAGNAQIEAAPAGFVTLAQEGQLDGVTIPQFKLSYTTGGQTTELWASDTSQMAYWELAWVAPDTAAAGLPPFPVI